MKIDSKLCNIKGTQDFLPDKQLQRNKITDALKTTFEAYGFLPVETSILCPFELLSSKYAGGDEILKEVYKLSDQGKRNLGLRYDLTVPFSKIVASNKNLVLPFKRYEIGRVFRDGPVKAGRCREFYQCDVDVCGVEGQEIEVEFFTMCKTAYSKLGINIIIEWNNRKFLCGLMEFCNIPKDKISDTIFAVDKIEKVGEQNVIDELKEIGITEDLIIKLFNMLKAPNLLSYFNDLDVNSNLKSGLVEIKKVHDLINIVGLKDVCVFTPFLARGLEIYTGTIWEVFDRDKNVRCSIGAGGRYDDIITNFVGDGKKWPAVGMTFGLEPIFEIIKKQNQLCCSPIKAQIFSFGNNIESLKLVQKFRESNIAVIADYTSNKIKKSIENTVAQNIKHFIILGEDEIATQKMTIKNLETGDQSLVNFEQALNILQ